MEQIDSVMVEDESQERLNDEAVVSIQEGLAKLLKRISIDNIQRMEHDKFRVVAFWDDPTTEEEFWCFGDNEAHIDSGNHDNDYVRSVFLTMVYRNKKTDKTDDVRMCLSLKTSDAFATDPSTEKPYKEIMISLKATDQGKNVYTIPESDVAIQSGVIVHGRESVYEERIEEEVGFNVRITNLDTDEPKIEQYYGVLPARGEDHEGATKFGLAVINKAVEIGNAIYDKARKGRSG